MAALDWTPLEQALAQLRIGLCEAEAHPENEVLRDGAIQRFEYTVELSWKFLHRVLRQEAGIQDVEIASKRDLFRIAARHGLIDDADQWFAFLTARNESSHLYRRAVAERVFAVARAFYPEAAALLERMRSW